MEKRPFAAPEQSEGQSQKTTFDRTRQAIATRFRIAHLPPKSRQNHKWELGFSDAQNLDL
jgi:hypothetical protein